jgi:hypothetical protein
MRPDGPALDGHGSRGDDSRNSPTNLVWIHSSRILLFAQIMTGGRIVSGGHRGQIKTAQQSI